MLEHGSYTKEVRDNIIIFSLIGEFNEHGVLACLKAQKEAIESFGEQGCYLLIDSSRQTGATPEAYKAVNDFYRDLSFPNLLAIAVVHTSYALSRLHERDIPEMAKHGVEMFNDVDSAAEWLVEQRGSTIRQYSG